MSLLTKEQQDKVERLRGYIEMPVRGKKSGRLAQSYSRNLLIHARSLLSIIDDLQARAPRETAEPDKDLPQEMHGYPFNMSLSYFAEQCKRHVLHPDGVDFSLVFEYIIERCSRAESRAPQPLATEQADKAMKDEAVRLLSRRQYTEQELREWFENRPLVQDEIDALLHEVVPGENEAWYSVLKFAAHVGALKAEP